MYRAITSPALYSSAAASSPAAADTSASWISLGSLPPSLEQRASLLSLPSGLAASMAKGARSGRRSKGKLVRNGQIVSKMYDALGSRPQPTNGLSLQQGIQLELEFGVPSFFTSGTTAGAPTFASRTFSVSDFAAASSLLSVFDQYKIEQIECWLDVQAPNSTGQYPLMVTAVDLDDGNVPTSIGQVQDHQGAIMASGIGGHYHKWCPHVALATYSGAFTSYANTPAQWIDSASPNVQHFGFKVAGNPTSGTAFAYALVVRAVISFRAPAIN